MDLNQTDSQIEVYCAFVLLKNIPSGSSRSLLPSPDPSNCLGLLLRFDASSVVLSVEYSFKAVNLHSHNHNVLLCMPYLKCNFTQ